MTARSSKLAAMADPAKNDSPEERAVALTKLGFGPDIDPNDHDALMVQATNMIGLVAYRVAQATTIGDIKDARALAKAVQGYVHDRSLGIEAENPAAAIVLVSEYKAGAELIRMAEAGERATERGSTGIASRTDPRPHLADLGVTNDQSMSWRTLARQYPSTEALLARIDDLPAGTRVSRAALSTGEAPFDGKLEKKVYRQSSPIEQEFDGIASIRKAVTATTALQGPVANGALAIDIGALSWEDSAALASEVEGALDVLVAILHILRGDA